METIPTPGSPKKPRATLYQVVIDDIMGSIESGAFSFDHPICTESRLMERYGISRITARRAMTELENRGVLYRKRGVGSFVSRDIYARQAAPQAAPNNLFAFIFPFNISRTGLTAAFQAANSLLLQKGCYASIYITEDDIPLRGRTVLNQLAGMNVAGVAYYPKTSDIHMSLLNQIIFRGKPVVIMDIPSNCPYISSVTSDNLGGSRQLMEHLLSLGHRRIAYISGVGPEERQTVCDRIAGYVMAHEKAGLPLRSEFIITDMRENLRRAPREGSGQTELLLQVQSLIRQGVTAIMAEHDELAFDILMACRELNISVPRDLSVCGFDDSEWAHMLPGAITTIRQDQEQIGRHVAELLMDNKGGLAGTARNLVVPTRLVTGTTTGPRPKEAQAD